MVLEVTPDALRSAPGQPAAPAEDPEVERVKAVLESRLLGGPHVATRIGRFVVIERVGAGGMGVVFSAFDPQLDRKVAIKLLFEDETDERELARLLGEAKAMAKLSHPNVVGVYEVGEHHGRVFVAMEYVRGRTLKRWLAEKPRSRRETLAMCVQAGRGLAAAHAVGIVHRDFKPDNVIVGDDERARVLDFGLARQTTDETREPQPLEAADSGGGATLTRLTRTGALLGTPAYMSPEQIRGESVDAHADQFGFCVTLWEALNGQRPFEGDSLPALVATIESGRIARPRRTGAPRGVEAVLRRGLRHDPNDRYADLNALLDALDRAVRPTKRWRWVRLVLLTISIPLGLFWLLWKVRLQADVEDGFVMMALAQSTPDELIASADAFVVEHSDASPINLAIVRLSRARASWLSSCANPNRDGLCRSPRARSSQGCRSSSQDVEAAQPRDPGRAEAAVVELREAIDSIGPLDIDRASKRGNLLAEVLDSARIAVADDALERYLAMRPPDTRISDPRELATSAWTQWLDDKRKALAALEQPWHQVSAVTLWSVAVPLRRGVAHQSLADEMSSIELPAEPSARREACAALAPILDEARRAARSAFSECIALVERTPDSALLATTCYEFRNRDESSEDPTARTE